MGSLTINDLEESNTSEVNNTKIKAICTFVAEYEKYKFSCMKKGEEPKSINVFMIDYCTLLEKNIFMKNTIEEDYVGW